MMATTHVKRRRHYTTTRMPAHTNFIKSNMEYRTSRESLQLATSRMHTTRLIYGTGKEMDRLQSPVVLGIVDLLSDTVMYLR
jgi:hypothetical protein